MGAWHHSVEISGRFWSNFRQLILLKPRCHLLHFFSLELLLWRDDISVALLIPDEQSAKHGLLQLSVVFLGLDGVDLLLYGVKLILLESYAAQLVSLLLQVLLAFDLLGTQLSEVSQVLVVLLKCIYKGFEELIVTETLRAQSNSVGVIHGEFRQNLLELLHLPLTLLHGLYDVVSIDRPFLEQLLNIAQICFEPGQLVEIDVE